MNTPVLQFLMLTVADWLNRRQVSVIEYLVAENRVLREHLMSRRLRLSDAQQRRLAVKGKALGRKGLHDVAAIVRDARRDPALVSGAGCCEVRRE